MKKHRKDYSAEEKVRPTALPRRISMCRRSFKGSSNGMRRQIGPDLMLLINDPAFARTLNTEPFNRQDFDDLFQFRDRSVMFGYKAPSPSKGDPRFITF